MQHEISDAEWMNYVGGTLAPARATYIQNHARVCAECARTLRDLARWHDALVREGARLRDALQMRDDEMGRFIARSLDTIYAGCEPERRNWSVTEGLFLMRSLMEPLFGAGTARTTIDLAVRRSVPYPESDLGRDNWCLFVANLAETVESVCGSAAGRLMSHAGASLAIRETW